MPLKNKIIPDFLTGGGSVGELLRNHDWSATPLGSPENWDGNLVKGIRVILSELENYQTKIRTPEDVSGALKEGELGTFTVDLQNGRTIWSDKTFEFLGIRQNEEVTLDIFIKAVHPEDRAYRQQVLERAMQNENGGFYEQEYRIVNQSNGNIIWVRTKGRVTFDHDGKPEKIIGIIQDVTKRKETEEGNKMFVSIIEASHEFIGLVAMDTTIQYGNPAALRMLGWDNIEGKNIMDCIYPEDHKLAAKLIPQLIKDGSFEHEIRFVNSKTGKPFWLQWNSFTIKSESGKIMNFGTVSTDITERKAAELVLRESEMRFRSLADQSPMIVFIMEPDKHASISYWSRTWLDFTGQTREEALGTAWNGFIHPDDVQKVMDAYLPAFENRTSYFIDAVRLKRYDGVYFWHMLKGNPQYKENGEFSGFVGVGFDINERKIAEELLKESEERFRTLAQRLPQLVWITDANGMQEFASARWEEYTGVRPSDSNSWRIVVHPEDYEKINEAWSHSLTTGEIYKYDVRLKSKDGEYRWHSVNGEPVYDKDNNIVKWVGAFTDIHYEKTFTQNLGELVEKSTNELRAKNEDLERMNKELESFAYISSHDLQEPLRKIQTYSSRILEHDYETLSEKSKDYFMRMENAALRMKTLIEDLLAYSRTTTENRVYETTHLSDIVEEIKEEFSEEIEQHHAIIETGELCDVDIIPFQFRQLMHNLVSNSIKFAKSDEPAHIVIKGETGKGSEFHLDLLKPRKKYCHISISDNGIGFAPEYSQKIFEVFQRLHGREAYDGTGIGLAIVKKIVENHDGVITAKSATNEGAVFDIYLPSVNN